MKSRFVYFIPSLLMSVLAIALALFGLMKYDAAEEANKASVASEPGPVAEVEEKPLYRYVVAVQPIEPGDRLLPESFIEIETATPIENAIVATDVPYDLIIETFMEAGELLTTETLEKQSLIRQVVPDGHTAIAFEMSSVASIGGLLKPGDFVDVFASFKAKGENEASSKTLLESIQVLAVQGDTTVGGSSSEDDRRRNSTMVLSIPEDKVRMLVLASREAQLNFAAVKRSPVAEESSATSSPDVKDEESEESVVFLSDLIPESPRSSREKASPERQRDPPGRKVQVFEGSEARNVYVQ
ncbi:MAG: Flp pilus assembly protein CpaB [Marinobacter sp.]